MEPKPKLYRVVMRNLGSLLSGSSVPDAAGLEKVDFEALCDAQHYAEQEKEKWVTVVVEEGTEKTGEFKEVERYQGGRKYGAQGGE